MTRFSHSKGPWHLGIDSKIGSMWWDWERDLSGCKLCDGFAVGDTDLDAMFDLVAVWNFGDVGTILSTCTRV